MVMFAWALAVALQGQELGATPGRCRSAADRFAEVVPVIRRKLADDANSPEPRYSAERRANVLKILESDVVHTANVQKRYASVTPTADENNAVGALGGAELGELIRRCDS